MPVLVEMTLFTGNRWTDDAYNTWLDDAYNTWADSDVTVKASNVSYAGERYWDQLIISMTPPQFRLDHLSGGYCKLGFGDITFTLDTFQAAGIWPPPDSCPVVISYADEDDVITQLFNGTLHRQALSRDGITYQLYERTFDALLLDEMENYDGDTVAIPRAFGAIQHQNPVRLPDAGGGNQVYALSGITGTLDTDWHVFDDGVDVCANVTNVTATTFELSVAPVGEVTISGTGSATTLVEIFTWACGASYLNLSLTSTLAAAFTVSYWATSQKTLVSFLDELCAYACHLFYVNGDDLYLVSMAEGNGTDIELTENDFFPSKIMFAQPVSVLKTTWIERNAVEETIGKYIKETSNEESATGTHPYGNEETTECFQSVRASIQAALAAIYGYMASVRWETSIPLESTFPVPGQKVVALDESMGQAINITIHARDIEYDFDRRIIRLSGEGSIA